MEALDPRFEFTEAAIVRDYVIGLGQSGLSLRLCGDYRVRLLLVFRVSLQQPLDLSLRRRIDDQHTVDFAFEAALYEQRNDQYLIRSAEPRRKPLQLAENNRVKNRFESLAPGRIAEYHFAHAAPIKSSVGVQDRTAELAGDGLESRLARSDNGT